MKKIVSILFAFVMIFSMSFASWSVFAEDTLNNSKQTAVEAESIATDGKTESENLDSLRSVEDTVEKENLVGNGENNKVELEKTEVKPARAPEEVKNFTVKKISNAQNSVEELVGDYDTFYDAFGSIPVNDPTTQYIIYLNRNVNIPAGESIWIKQNCNIRLNSAKGNKFTLTREGDGKSMFNLDENVNLHISNIILDGNNQAACMFASKDSNVILDNGTIIQNFAGRTAYSPMHFQERATLTVNDGVIIENNKSADDGYAGAIMIKPTSKLTVKGGEFKNNTSKKWGGAIVSFGDVEITGGTFTKNSSENKGGAIGSYSGSLKIDGAEFNDNLSTNFGGAIAVTAKSEVKITNTEFNRNSAKNGGAIHHNSSSTHKLIIEKVKFSNNTADSSGGALNLGFEADISECEFTGNGGDSTRWGGAIVASFKEVAKVLNVNKSKFDKNKAALGGGISLYGGTLNVNETELNNNIGGPYEKDGDYDLGGGGAIILLKNDNVSNVLNIKNSQVIGNKARYGAGILAEEGNLDVQSTIFDGNTTEGPDEAHPGRQGGGLYLFEEANATISKGTKFIKNKASWGGAIYTSSHDQGNNPVDETKYKNLKTDITTLFIENYAANGLYEPPKNFAVFSNLEFDSDSDVLHGVLNSKSLINNYDINYKNPEKVITYDANGGKFADNEIMKRILYPVNEKIKIYEAPTREGWTFDYWKGSSYQPGDSYTVVEDHLFIAQWRNESPKIEVENKTIEKGTDLDLKKLIVSATDKEDGDLKSKVEIIDNGGFDKDKVGKYTITFKVTDKGGASTIKKAIVTVIEKDKPTPNTDNNKPQAPNSKMSPKTGDSSNLALYGMLIGLSGLLLIAAKARKSRK